MKLGMVTNHPFFITSYFFEFSPQKLRHQENCINSGYYGEFLA